jgi:hypothetical protein
LSDNEEELNEIYNNIVDRSKGEAKKIEIDKERLDI